jgi:drug/metabolite transporter (DMT)-like permease
MTVVLSERRAVGLVLLAACAFGSLAIGVTLASAAGVSLVALMSWRYALASPLLVVAAGGPAHVRVPVDKALALLLLGGGGQTLITYLSFSSLEWLSAAQLGFLFYTYPAWVALFAALAGSEALTPVRVAALGLALAGIALMVGTPWTTALPFEGVIRALGSAVIYAGYIPLLHRMRGPLPAAVASAWVITGAAIVFTSWALVRGDLFTGMTLPMWGIAVASAVISTVIAFITFLRGLAALGAVRTAILSTVEPFWTALLAALVLAQPLTRTTLLGGLVIVVAIWLLQRTPNPAIPDAPPPE